MATENTVLENKKIIQLTKYELFSPELFKLAIADPATGKTYQISVADLVHQMGKIHYDPNRKGGYPANFTVVHAGNLWETTAPVAKGVTPGDNVAGWQRLGFDGQEFSDFITGITVNGGPTIFAPGEGGVADITIPEPVAETGETIAAKYEALTDVNRFTNAYKTKLDQLQVDFVGRFETPAALDTKFPTANDGQWALVNDGTGVYTIYTWDTATTDWINTGASSFGDMLKNIYDPQNIGGDSFDLANMHGLLAQNKVNGLEAALVNIWEGINLNAQKITTIESTLTSHDSRITTNTNNLGDLTNRVTTVEDNMVTGIKINGGPVQSPTNGIINLTISDSGGNTGVVNYKLHHGAGTPVAGLGAVGHNYYQTTTGNIYTKEASGWVFAFQIAGGGVETVIEQDGAGFELYAGVTDGIHRFKTLTAGTNIQIVEDVFGELRIEASAGAAGEINTGVSLGTGHHVFAGKVGAQLQFKSILAGPNVTITSQGSTVTIAAAAPGEVNTAANLTGSGTGLYLDKVAEQFRFRRIVAGTNISTALDGNGNLVINSTGGGTGTTGGEVNTGASIGNGTALYFGKDGEVLQFKSISPGSNVQITDDGEGNILISATDTDTGEVNTGQSMGTGIAIYNSKQGEVLRFNSLVAGNNVNISNDGNGNITIESTDTGENNTGSSLGDGFAVFAGKQGADLQFNSIKAGNNITITNDGNGSLVITGTDTNTGENNTASNLGAAVPGSIGIYEEKNGVELQFNSLLAGSNITLTKNADGTILITAAAPDGGEMNTAANVGGGVGLYAQKVGSELQFKTFVAGTNISFVENGDGTITVNSTTTATGEATLQNEIVVNGTDWGGWKNGDTLLPGLTMDEILARALIVAEPVTYQSPTLSLNVTGASSVVEVGSSIDLGALATFTQRDGGACSGVDFKKGGSIVASDAAAPYEYDPAPFVIGQETITYSASAAYAQGPVKTDNLGNPQPAGQIPAGTVNSNSVTFKGARAGFFGTDNPGNTSANIRALALHVLDLKSGDKINLPIPQGTEKVTFALLASLGSPSSVVYVEGNVQVKGNFETIAANVQGAGGFASASYNVFTYTPAAPFTGARNYEITIA